MGIDNPHNGGNIMSSPFAGVVTAIEGALSSGNTTLASQLGTLLHVGSTTTGLDFTKKTMTTTWYNSNQSAAIPLVAGGWTIVPG
jgi:hypothetical protein